MHCSSRVVLEQTISQGGVSDLSENSRYAWHPFGGMLQSYGDSEPQYGFTGQEKDHESGLHNFRARAYHEQLGRFFAVDPQGQYHSPYVYGGNNPLMIVDPDGELAWFVIPLIVGAVTGGLNVYDQYQKGNLGDWKSYLGAFGVGFASGFVATALAPQTLAYFGGSAVAGAGGFIAGSATGAVLSGLDYSIRAIGNGILFRDFSYSLEGLGMQMGMGALTGGTLNGIASKMNGNGFWTGNVPGGQSSALTSVDDVLRLEMPKPKIAPLEAAKIQPKALPLEKTQTILQKQTSALPDGLLAADDAITGIQPYYPPNDGALNNWSLKLLEKNTIIDRYGLPNGYYASPKGTPLQMRALPHGVNTNIKTTIMINKPIWVQESIVAPAFGKLGQGIQYKFPVRLDILKDLGDVIY